MNRLLESGQLTEIGCGQNFSYILDKETLFFSTEYKVMQNQTTNSFLKCMKMLYNGKIQLYYLTDGYKTLSALLPTLDPDSFLTICSNLFSNIMEVKNNGFLSCQNIDISFEKIYVDIATYKVSLVYLPVVDRIYDDFSSFEDELRTNLIKLIQSICTFSVPKVNQFAVNLANGTLGLEDIYLSIKSGKAPIPNFNKDVVPEIEGSRTQIKVVAMNAPMRVEIVVNKNDFTIGKKAELVDGVVSFNKMISRSHCKITQSGGQYYITDLQSANGTFVNHIRIQPNKAYPIKIGDIIRLANSDFQIVAD